MDGRGRGSGTVSSKIKKRHQGLGVWGVGGGGGRGGEAACVSGRFEVHKDEKDIEHKVPKKTITYL